MISLKNISYSIKNKPLLTEVSTDFEDGKMHLILGPNGAGKSTMIKILTGELKPTQGEVTLDNKLLETISIKELAQFRAVLSQSIELSFPLTVHEVVMLGRHPHSSGKSSEKDEIACDEAIKYFDLHDFKNRNYLTLSGGEKQRVQFARVFTQIWYPIKNKKRYLFLDEPLTFLDIYYQYNFMEKILLFKKSNPDITIIGVVHDLNIAATFADNVILLYEKGIFELGTPQNVLTEKNIKQVFKIFVKNNFEYNN